MPKSFQCLECGDGLTVFDSEEALLTHKWTMIKATKRKTHMRCHVCKLDHRTFAGLVRHYQICHPAPQKLSCPGCAEGFDRLHQLMDHLESDKCPSILAARVRQNRMLQVHATNVLAAAAAGSGGGSIGIINNRPVTAEAAILSGIGPGIIEGADLQTLQDLARLQSQRAARLLEGDFDADNNSVAETEGPIFEGHQGGVTLGDFGGFINIKPKMAEAMAAAVAADNEQQQQQQQQQQKLLQASSSLYDGGLVSASRRVPPTSAEAVEEMLEQQRQRGRGGGENKDKDKDKNKDNDKGKEKSKENLAATARGTADSTQQSVRAFRQGDAKGPDLLTDDTSPIAQRFKNLQVWAGQETLAMHESSSIASASAGPGSVSTTVRTSSVAPSTRLGTAAPSITGSTRLVSGVGGRSSSTRPASAERTDDDNRFIDVTGCRDPFTGRYTCPHEMCQRSGKQYKTAGGLVAHLRSKTAHTTERQQCPSCFGWFTSLHALTQHIESQSTRCHFRNTEEYVPFVNILSAGVADVQGHNADMTLAYAVKPGAAEALVEDGLPTAQELARWKKGE